MCKYLDFDNKKEVNLQTFEIGLMSGKFKCFKVSVTHSTWKIGSGKEALPAPTQNCHLLTTPELLLLLLRLMVNLIQLL